MITRIWHGRTKTTDAVVYRQYVIDTGIPEYLATPGNRGAQIWQKTAGDVTHIWTVSWWDDLESIKGFAGEDISKAHYYDEDEKYLLEFEPYVQHYEAYDFPPLQ
ncbi:MAG: antibiotic biosynthesis monooxygenase [Niastella sp.]|nr:antibiotic biosynthesis monooxygenase [Niastella sp.]